MKVIENKKTVSQTTFADLCVGNVYRDADGSLCIKTDHDEDYCGKSNCIVFLDEYWCPEVESYEAVVTPVKATLTVEG